MKKSVAAIVLAAGRSTRMGHQNKLSTPWRGVPLLSHVLTALASSDLDPVIVVTGHEADQVCDLIPESAITVFNGDFASGMASSLRTGVERAGQGNCDGVMILLGDMPMITTPHIEQMLQAFDAADDDAIIQAAAQGKPGNPVLISRRYFPQLMKLSGDRGARDILKSNAASVVRVEIGEAAGQDFDTPDAFASRPE